MIKDENSLTALTHQGNHSGKRNQELEKSKVHIIVEIIEYVPNAVLSKNHY